MPVMRYEMYIGEILQIRIGRAKAKQGKQWAVA